MMKKTPVVLLKSFPINHAHPKYLAADDCGSAILQDHDKVGLFVRRVQHAERKHVTKPNPAMFAFHDLIGKSRLVSWR